MMSRSQSQNQTHHYEVALFGEFFARDLKAILNRFTLNSESAQRLHTREVLFEPLDAHYQRDSGSDPVILRAKKDLTEPDSDWALYCYLKIVNMDNTRFNPSRFEFDTDSEPASGKQVR